jgi:hypothetical protein
MDILFLLDASPDGDSEIASGSDRWRLWAAVWIGRIQENPKLEAILHSPHAGAGAREPPSLRNDARIAHRGISA